MPPGLKQPALQRQLRSADFLHSLVDDRLQLVGISVGVAGLDVLNGAVKHSRAHGFLDSVKALADVLLFVLPRELRPGRCVCAPGAWPVQIRRRPHHLHHHASRCGGGVDGLGSRRIRPWLRRNVLPGLRVSQDVFAMREPA